MILNKMDTFYRLHIAAFLIHAISSALTFVFATNTATRKILLEEFVFDGNTTRTDYVQIGENQDPISWLHINEILTALSHLYAIVKYRNEVVYDGMHEKETWRRTVEYTFTAGILQVALLLGSGDVFIHDLIFVLGINALLQFVGYIIDQHEKDDINIMKYYTLGFGLLILELVYVVMHTVSIKMIDSKIEDIFGFLVLIGIFYFIFYVSFGILKLVGTDDEGVSEKYVILSVTTKISLSWMLIGNVYLGWEKHNNCESLSSDQYCNSTVWTIFQVIWIIFGCAGLVVVFWDKLRGNGYNRLG
ncbi:MAG: hypothetical protein CL881_01760 [Dehalococcoidia bacterium]|nr:hypothetical protein [Dehalococcoidia bacterium]